MIRELLAGGAQVNGQTKSGNTALSEAARYGHIESVKMLLQAQADPNLCDENGCNPLHQSGMCIIFSFPEKQMMYIWSYKSTSTK